MNDLLRNLEQLWNTPLGPFLLGGGGIVLALILLAIIVGWLRQRPGPVAQPDLTVELGALAPPPPLPEGAQPLRCHALPCRIRLIVAAPLGTDAGAIIIEDVLPMLDAAMPGLAAIAHRDQPLVRLWPTQLSNQGFAAAFRRHAQLPNPEATIKPWILVMGRVLRHGRSFALGLALLADREHTLGPIQLDKPHEWMEVLQQPA
jgi:hypothetical protein